MTQGIVNIHGKKYKTVALRVNEFRESHPDWTISTDLIESSPDIVVMKATISDGDRVIGTGHAEEKRNATQINRTSALENCETSAIGRALAACGYAGEEYASANEVENAIHQQEEKPKPTTRKNITKSQAADLKSLAEEAGADMDKLLKFYGIDSFIGITKVLHDDIAETLKRKIAKG